LSNSISTSDIYNLGGEKEYTLLDTAIAIGNLLAIDLDYKIMSADRPGHGARYAVDSKKILAAGFRPKYDFSTGISQFIDWAVNNKEWLT